MTRTTRKPRPARKAARRSDCIREAIAMAKLVWAGAEKAESQLAALLEDSRRRP